MPNSTSSTEFLEVARVRGVHGLTGLVKVELYWGPSSALSDASEVTLDLGNARRTLIIERVERAPKGWLVKFAGVSDRDAASALMGGRIFVARSALAPLADGESYLVDLVGFEVMAPDGIVGRVVEVLVNPSVDSVVIETPDGRRCEQALAPPFLEGVDRVAGRISLTSREGLID